MTLPLKVYRGVTRLALPRVLRREREKLREAGFGARVSEKDGVATVARPEGRLIWLHGASVGESVSALALIRRLGELAPEVSFLLTSGTATSASVVAGRLPPRTWHQFAPLDAPGPVARFYQHWRPDGAVLIESELWPNLMTEAHGRGVPMALVNARMSARSLARWGRMPGTARALLAPLKLILTQTEETATGLARLSGLPAAKSANLKAMGDPLPRDAGLTQALKDGFGKRPVWTAASVHVEELEAVLAAHRAVRTRVPEAALLLIPRHPDRLPEMDAPRRSRGELPDINTPLYLLDTVGEMGSALPVSPRVFLAGSLVPGIGGHNPFEVAQAGAAILSGRHVANWAEVFRELEAEGAVTLTDAASLAGDVVRWMEDERALGQARDAARAVVRDPEAALTGIAEQVLDALS